MSSLFISHKTSIVEGTIEVPSSKSISNRALILQYLYGQDKIILDNLSSAHDTKLLIECIDQIAVHQATNNLTNSAYVIDASNAGTTFRFLTALLAICKGNWILTGDERMQQRPIKPLVDALLDLGAQITYINNDNYPPLKIIGTELLGGEVSIETNESSQFINALLLIAPILPYGLKIKIPKKPVSESYITNTIGLLEMFGIKCEKTNDAIIVEQAKDVLHKYTIEPDWSSLAFIFEIAALSKQANIEVLNVSDESIQGDYLLKNLAPLFQLDLIFEKKKMIIKKESKAENQKFKNENFIFNFNSTPDLAQPIAVACAALNIDAEINGIDHLAYKETNRLEALKTELNKIKTNFYSNKPNSYYLKTDSNYMPQAPTPLSFKTYNDHRMAMSFAPLCLKYGRIEIENYLVVQKSFPTYWEELKKLGFTIEL